jgi:multidrug efflux pump subunit AcrB
MKPTEKSLIANFSTAFVKNPRVTFLLLIGILILGFTSYTRFLTREGFPAVDVPLVMIQTPYFVNDANQVDKDITVPIEKAISGIREIEEVTSTTTENFSIIIAEFDQDTDTKEATTLLRDAVEEDASLPNGADIKYKTFNAGAVDGDHDLVFTVSGEKTISQLQEKAEFVADKVEKVGVVVEANVIELITKEKNPLTGEEFDYQSGFNRVGIREDGEIEFSPAIGIGIVKKGETGLIDLSEAVRDEVKKIQEDGDLDGFKVSYGGDFADPLRKLIGDLEGNAINGLLAVVFILFFIISWRASIVTAMIIPTVIGATLIGLFLIGYTLNVIVLFSLILILGLIVDDAIVVVEAIDYQKRLGVKGIKAISEAITDIAPADIAGTLTTVLVFLPMAFVSGILGEFIVLIPITVILALVLSITIGLSIIPFLSSILIADKKPAARKFGAAKVISIVIDTLVYGFGKAVNQAGFYVSRFVNFYLRKWVIAIFLFILSMGAIAIGGFYASQLTFAVFAPAKDSDQINLTITFPTGIEVAEAEQIAQDIESLILVNAEKHIEAVNYYMATKESATMITDLTPIDSRNTTAEEISGDLRSEFEDIEDTQIRVEQVGAGPPTDEFQINARIFSEDESLLTQAADDVKTFLHDRKIEGGGEVTKVVIDYLDNISKVDGRRFAVVKTKISDPNNTGLIINLKNSIEKEYDESRLTSLGLEEDAIEADLGMEGENIESFNSAIFALMAALILMYILLVLQFNSFSQPLLIFLAIPFTFPGLFPGLSFTDNALSFFVLLGIIALSGIVVNNTIFLVDYANQARREGKDIIDSITQAIRIRFRPIIATSLTTVLALLPLTVTDPFWEGLGLTIIFGLLSSSIMVIFAFPVFYAVVESLRVVRSRVWRRLTNS